MGVSVVSRSEIAESGREILIKLLLLVLVEVDGHLAHFIGGALRVEVVRELFDGHERRDSGFVDGIGNFTALRGVEPEFLLGLLDLREKRVVELGSEWFCAIRSGDLLRRERFEIGEADFLRFKVNFEWRAFLQFRFEDGPEAEESRVFGGLDELVDD